MNVRILVLCGKIEFVVSTFKFSDALNFTRVTCQWRHCGHCSRSRKISAVDGCEISKRVDNSKIQSHSIEISQDPVVKIEAKTIMFNIRCGQTDITVAVLACIRWGQTSFDFSDVIIGVVASQFTSLTIVYSNVYLGADQRKHQSSTSLALWGEFTGYRWIPRTKGQ